jgi:thiosulfate/3-mercaptopyruvate sulfurtransferase
MGITHTDPILVYGDADSSWGGEGWLVWVLALLGHQGPVRFLDGGINAWQARGLPLTREKARPRDSAVYQPTVNDDIAWSADRVAARQQEVTLVDTRGYLTEWLPGHLPGAVHIPWEKFYQGKTRTVLPPEDLKALLIKNGVDVTRPVVYYCTGGIRSGFTWLVHVLSGLPGAVNFEGGTEAWKAGRDLVR